MGRLFVRLLIVAALAGVARAQEPASVAAPAAAAEPAKPWGWVHPDRDPFEPWHTDVELQTRLYDEAYSRASERMEIELPERIQIMLMPSYGFFFIGMNVGAKDGSLLLETSSSRAMEQLSFVADAERKPESIGEDWRGDPNSPMSFASACYAPKHVKRMIVVNCDLAQDKVGPALEHEFVHALQDEVFGFKEFFAFEGITIDEKWARQAIEEGYATRLATPGRPQPGPELLWSQDWSVQQLGFFYGTGGQLVDSVRERAESPRELLTLLFAHPPSTTREVLHPELYAQRLEGAPLELPEPAAFTSFRDALSRALTAAGHPSAWNSRVGEFGLSCVLSELGLPIERAAPLAQAWRNDALVNHGTWRDPTTTSVVWLLESPETAADLAATLVELISARSAPLALVEISLGDEPHPAHAALDIADRPDALILHSADNVALVIGGSLSSLVATPPTPPAR